MLVVAAVILAWVVVASAAAVLLGRNMRVADELGSRVGSRTLDSEPTVELVPYAESRAD